MSGIVQTHGAECDKPTYCWCPVASCSACDNFLCATCEDVRDGSATLADLAAAAGWTA